MAMGRRTQTGRSSPSPSPSPYVNPATTALNAAGRWGTLVLCVALAGLMCGDGDGDVFAVQALERGGSM